jgi:hypothetical protein
MLDIESIGILLRGDNNIVTLIIKFAQPKKFYCIKNKYIQ